MEAVTKKTVTIEFGGRKYALPDDSTIGELLEHLGLPHDMPIRLKAKDGGFVLVCNN